ncbi:hypothetical protein C8R47DRAFT_948711, partial [Mycena vitilis]
IPLSAFTTDNLDFINSNHASLATLKYNSNITPDKQVRLLDILAFQESRGREQDMTRGQWLEGAKNFLEFIAFMEGEGSAAHVRWDAHFGFFDRSEKGETYFAAYKAAEI